MVTDGIEAVTFFMAMTTFLSLIAVSFVVIMVFLLVVDMYANDKSQEKSMLRISPSWRGVRIFKTMPNVQAQLWVPWGGVWPVIRLGFAVWRA